MSFKKKENFWLEEYAMKPDILNEISKYIDLDEETLLKKGVEAYLREKRRELLMERLEILSRYDSSTPEEIERKIEAGEVNEHPAWEDLITLENIDEALSHFNEYHQNLQQTT